MNKAHSLFLIGFLCLSFPPGADLCAFPPQSDSLRSGRAEPGKTRPPLAFIHVNVIPMDRETVLLDHTVLVEGDRISGLGPSAATSILDGSTVIDGSGLFLIPGLTDAHVHLDQEIGARPDFGDAALFLAHGVTTVFNLRGEPQHLEWKKRIQEGKLLAPNLYTAGEFVNEPRVNTAEEAEREVQGQLRSGYDIIKFREIIDFKDWRVLTTKGMEKPAYLRLNEAARESGLPLLGHAPYRVGLSGLIQAGQPLAHINELANLYFLPPLSGEGFITVAKWSFLFLLLLGLTGSTVRLMAYLLRRAPKLATSEIGSILNSILRLVILSALCILLWILVVPPGRLFGQVWLLALLSAASVFYLVEIFRLLRRLILARPKIRLAVFVRVFGLISFIAALGPAAFVLRWVPFAWRGSDLVINRVARDLKEAGIWVQSTLVLYETGMGTRDGFRYEQRIQNPAFQYLPAPLQEQWKGIREMVPHWMVKVWGRHPEFTRKLTASLHRAGVPIMAGTDALGAPFVIPGASLHQELQLLGECALSPYEVISAATSEPARFLGKQAEFGVISAGKRADLILVEGNPLLELGCLKKLRGVVVRGTWLSRERLDGMLAEMIGQDSEAHHTEKPGSGTGG